MDNIHTIDKTEAIWLDEELALKASITLDGVLGVRVPPLLQYVHKEKSSEIGIGPAWKAGRL